MCDLTRPHRGTVSKFIRVKVHRCVVAVSVGRKSSASIARNLMTNWTWIARVPILFGGGGVVTSLGVYPKLLCCQRNQVNSA